MAESLTEQEQQAQDEAVVVSLTLSYNGAPFAGFARQPRQLTVQGSVEEALKLIFHRPVETVCAGRTDAGVHARGQQVSFELTREEWEERSEQKLLRSLNALTHEAISVRDLQRRPAGFSARFSATVREYKYFVCIDEAEPLLMRDFSWHVPRKINVVAMQKAAQCLIGEHDFKSFCTTASAEGKSTMRNVFSVGIGQQEQWGEHLIVFTISGNAFLHSMVRTMVGTLMAVGLGKREPEWVQRVLEARDRSAAGENAPAKGLVFWRVGYEGVRVHTPVFDEAAPEAPTAGASALTTAPIPVQPQPAADALSQAPKGPAQQVAGVSSGAPDHTSSMPSVAQGAPVPPGVSTRKRKKRRKRKQEAEFHIPRGDGRYVMSGAGLSELRDSSTGFYSAHGVKAGSPELSGPMLAVADEGQFGDVAWEDSASVAVDEPSYEAPSAPAQDVAAPAFSEGWSVAQVQAALAAEASKADAPAPASEAPDSVVEPSQPRARVQSVELDRSVLPAEADQAVSQGDDEAAAVSEPEPVRIPKAAEVPFVMPHFSEDLPARKTAISKVFSVPQASESEESEAPLEASHGKHIRSSDSRVVVEPDAVVKSGPYPFQRG